MALKTGDRAPDFTLPDDTGAGFNLADMAGRRVLLVFYPGDDTPVCTAQLCEYRDGIEEFKDLGVDVIGVSSDDADSHQKFKQKHRLPFTLLSDSNLSVAEQYGCKGVLGMKRGVFLLDEEQVIRYAHVETVSVFRRRKAELIEAIQAM